MQLSSSEELLRNTIDSSMDMIQVFQAVRNEDNEIIDFIWILNNKVSEGYYGDVIGKSLLTLNPGVVETGIFDTFKKVVETGQPDQSIRHCVHEQFDGWFHQSTVKQGDGVTTTTKDITELKKTEQQILQLKDEVARKAESELSKELAATKRAELNAAFLDSVTKMLAGQSTPDEIMTLAAVQIGQFFKVSACVFADVNEAENEVTTNGWMADGLPSQVKQTFRFDDYVTDELRRTAYAGEVFAINDTQHDWRVNAENYAKMGIGAVAAFHFKWLGKWTNYLAVTDTRARVWREDEITLLQELSDRIFLRRERALSEEALRESEEKFRTIFNSIDEAFFIIEVIYNEADEAVDYRLLEANPAFEQLTGIKNAVGKLGSEYDPTSEGYSLETFDRVARTGESLRFENYHAPTDRWYHCYYTRNGGVGSRQVAAVFNEITERKHQEYRQQYLLKLSDALRSLADPLVIQQTAMKIIGEQLGAHRAFYGDMLDDEDTLLIGPGYANTVAPLQGYVRFSEFDTDMVRYYRHGQTIVINDIAADVINTDYSRRVMESIRVIAAVGVPLLKGGKVKGILSIHQSHPRKWTPAEIALIEETAERTWSAVERAKAEEALRASEEQQAFLLKLSDALRAATSADAAETVAVELTAAQFQVNRCYVGILIPDENRSVVAHEHRRPDLPSMIGEYRYADFPESVKRIEAGRLALDDIQSSASLADEDKDSFAALRIGAQLAVFLKKGEGRMTWSLTVADETARQWTGEEAALLEEIAERTWAAVARAKAEEALRKSEMQLKKLLVLRDEFIGVASHELKTPVTSMRAYAEMAEEYFQEKDENAPRQLLQRIIAQIDRLNKLISHLLDTTQISEGKLRLHVENIDIVALVQERADEIQRTTDDTISVSFEQVPLVQADKERIGQVVTNLLSNAIKYSPRKSKIKITISDDGDNVVVAVRDHGYGIPEEDQQRVFERFFRVTANNMDTYPGMGLGLYITAQIVHRHGGQIAVSSKLGEGSIFSFTLPK